MKTSLYWVTCGWEVVPSRVNARGVIATARIPVIYVGPFPVDASQPGSDGLKIRAIAPTAAGRRYVRGNFVTAQYVREDGMNSPADLVTPTSWNHGNPRKEKKLATRRAGRPVVRIFRPVG